MNNFSKVGSKSFKYRFFIRECLGIFLTVMLGVLALIGVYSAHASSLYFFVDAGIILLLILQLLLVYGITLLEFKNLEYLIEVNSISLREGILSSHTETIPFEKIKNSSFDQSLVQRFFSVGNITIDQDDEKYIWQSIDESTAHTVMESVSAKSNIQPIVVAANNSANVVEPTNPTIPMNSLS